MTGPEYAARLLNSRSIALVGASEQSLWTQALVANLTTLGFEGDVHLVNPRRTELLGRPCHPSLADVPGDVDCAYVMVGTEHAAGVLEECGRRGVRSAVLLTAGFKEVGGQGVEREHQLVSRARELGIGVLGPNCLGFVDYTRALAAYGLLVVPPIITGGVGLISQSGAMLLAFHRMAQSRGIGLAQTVSIGNEGMLTSADFIQAMVADPGVKVVGALLEGFRDPAAFLKAADAAMRAAKPLVVFKLAGTEATARAVSAHTGSLAGADDVVDAVFRQRGIVRVRSLEELVETCAVLATSGWPRGGRTAVITTSGGACGIVSDLAEGTAIELPDFAPETKARLAEILPAFGTSQNPLDTTGVIVDQPELLAACLRAVAAGGAYDAFLVNSDPPREPGPNPERLEQRIRLLAEALQGLPFAAAASTAAMDLTSYARDLLSRHGLHFANGLTLGTLAVHHAIEYGRARAHAEARPRGESPPRQTEGSAVRGTMTEAEAKRLLAGCGIPSAPERIAASAEAAALAADELGYPVVVKVLSRDITHKTEIGGVRLGLRNGDQVRNAYDVVTLAARAAAPTADIEGVLVARQVDPLAELLIGMKRDPVFGPVLVAGVGGVLVEVMRDVAVRLPPVDTDAALEMLLGLRGAPLLLGARGRPRGDVEAAASAIAALSRLVLDLGDRVTAIDVNPLFVLPAGEGVLAGDALVELQ